MTPEQEAKAWESRKDAIKATLSVVEQMMFDASIGDEQNFSKFTDDAKVNAAVDIYIADEGDSFWNSLSSQEQREYKEEIKLTPPEEIEVRREDFEKLFVLELQKDAASDWEFFLSLEKD